MGLRRVELELDSQVVISLVTSTDRTFQRHFWLTDGCRTLLRRGWEVNVRHTHPEGNMTVDWITNYAGTLSLGYHECDGAFAGIHDVMLADLSEVGTSRISRRVSFCVGSFFFFFFPFSFLFCVLGA
ncbi:hypothetical protein M5689_002762 [Euphorbia peplus]|nr:hypothetical protein M5689_002762 [Euphorbia peplus]